jgi:hypothetical protein
VGNTPIRQTHGRARSVHDGNRVVIVLALIRKTRKTGDHVIKLPLERARSLGQMTTPFETLRR